MTPSAKKQKLLSDYISVKPSSHRQEPSYDQVDKEPLRETASSVVWGIDDIWNADQKSFFLSENPWLHISEKNALGCSFCRDAKLSGIAIKVSPEWSSASVTGTGTSKHDRQKCLRKKLYKHRGSDTHKKAAQILHQRSQGIIDEAIARGSTHVTSVTMRCIRTAYYIAHNNRPISDYPDLISLHLRNGADMGTTQRSRPTCAAMVEVIAASMRQQVIRSIIDQQSNLSLIADESTSTSKKSCLVLYVRSQCSDGPLQNIFLDMRELPGQDSQSIYDTILMILNENGFSDQYLKQHLISFTSDGASVMLGKKNGVGAKLKKTFPQIILWHCLNHRLELAVSDALGCVDNYFHVEAFFDKIYSTYSRSAKLQRELQSIASDLDIELKKVGKIFSIRWVASSYRAVNALWKSYPALYEHFSALSEKSDTSSTERAVFKGLCNKMSNQDFVEDLALIRDCLGQLATLSETLQARDMNFVMANRHINWTVNALRQLKRAVAEEKYSFNKIMEQNHEETSEVTQSTNKTTATTFKDIRLHYSNDRHGERCSFNRQQFIQALIDNIGSRMIKTENEKSIREFEILIPEMWPSNVEVPWLSGERQLQNLTKRFQINVPLHAFRSYIDNPRHPPKAIETLKTSILDNIAISSAEAERGFSQMNLIMTPMRSLLNINLLSALLFINVNGPPAHLWDGTAATKKWLSLHKSAVDRQVKASSDSSETNLRPIQKLFTVAK